MNSSSHGAALTGGALLAVAAASPARAEGTFDIPAGAHFNPEKLAKIGDYFRDEIAPATSPARSC